MHFFSLFELILTILIISHLFACIWHGVAYYNASSAITWLKYYGLDSSPIIERYNKSFYWATMTMVTVGYGDLTGQNQLEVFTSNITMYLACGVFAFSVNSIGRLIDDINKDSSERRRKIGIMNNYLKINEIDANL